MIESLKDMFLIKKLISGEDQFLFMSNSLATGRVETSKVMPVFILEIS